MAPPFSLMPKTQGNGSRDREESAAVDGGDVYGQPVKGNGIVNTVTETGSACYKQLQMTWWYYPEDTPLIKEQVHYIWTLAVSTSREFGCIVVIHGSTWMDLVQADDASVSRSSGYRSDRL